MVERVLDAVFPHDGVVLGGGRGAAAGHLAAALLAAAQHADQPLLRRKLCVNFLQRLVCSNQVVPFSQFKKLLVFRYIITQ